MPKTCVNCGVSNKDAARFCKHCGAALAGAPAALSPTLPPTQTGAPTQAAPLPTYPPVQSPAPAPGQGNLFTSGLSAAAVLIDQAHGQTFSLGSVTTIGRAGSCDIVLSASSVSFHHATISEVGGQWQIVDQQSRNGTYVHAAKIVSATRLDPGTQIQIGSEVFQFQLSGNQGTTLLDSAQLVQPPGQSLSSDMRSSGKRGWFEPVAHGEVLSQPAERQDQPPTDWARLSVMFAVVTLFAGVMLGFLISALVIGAVLICLGGAVFLPLLFLFLAPVQAVFRAAIGGLWDEKPVTIVNLHIEDEFSGRPLDVTFVRKRGSGGGVALGDKIEVWGRKLGDAVTATRILVIERNGHLTRADVPVRRSWPWSVAVFAWISTIAALVYAYLAISGS